MSGNGFTGALHSLLGRPQPAAPKTSADLKTLADLKEYIAPFDTNCVSMAMGTPEYNSMKEKIYEALMQVTLHNLKTDNRMEVYQIINHWCISRKDDDGLFINHVIAHAIQENVTTVENIKFLFMFSSNGPEIIAFLASLHATHPVPKTSRDCDVTPSISGSFQVPKMPRDEEIIELDAIPAFGSVLERNRRLLLASGPTKRKGIPISGPDTKAPRHWSASDASPWQQTEPMALQVGGGSSQALVQLRPSQLQQMPGRMPAQYGDIEHQLSAFVQLVKTEVSTVVDQKLQENDAKNQVFFSEVAQVARNAQAEAKLASQNTMTAAQLLADIRKDMKSSAPAPASDIGNIIPGCIKSPMQYTVEDFFPAASEEMTLLHTAKDITKIAALIKKMDRAKSYPYFIIAGIQRNATPKGEVAQFVDQIMLLAKTVRPTKKKPTAGAPAHTAHGVTGAHSDELEDSDSDRDEAAPTATTVEAPPPATTPAPGMGGEALEG